MTPQQAAFCVLHPDHPESKRLIERDWDFMMLDPRNKAAFDETVQRFADDVLARVVKKVEEKLR